MKSEFWSGLSGFLLLAAFIIAIWIANFFLMPIFFPADSSSLSNAGTAGDMFGGITALFSGLAFAGLITTLFMQRKELELQRNELTQTRNVFQIQRFENTFFGLIKLLNDHVIAIGSEEISGKIVLVRYATSLPTPYTQQRNPLENREQLGPKKSFEEINREYEKYFTTSLESNLAPYFRLIYNIIRHIEHTKFSENPQENDETKLMYSKMLRAHLNSAEVKLLMFNCASIHGRGLKGWVEKHAMLKHLTREDYQKFDMIVSQYDCNAFQFESRKVN